MFSLGQRVRGADVIPLAVMNQAKETACPLRPIKKNVQRERAIRRIFEEFRTQNRETGEDKGATCCVLRRRSCPLLSM